MLTPITPTPVPVWAEEFTTLDLTTSTHVGSWRTNDRWQNPDMGYRDFAGTSWNANPAETPTCDPFTLAGSRLTIAAVRTPVSARATIAASMRKQGQVGPVPQWCGGMLITNPDVITFRYGWFEFGGVRYRPGRGMFPAIWFYSTELGRDPLGKGSAEIDLLEIFGHGVGRPWSSSLHFNDNDGASQRPSVSFETDLETTRSHTYALDWQPAWLRFYRDGVLIREVTGPDAAWFDTTMGIRINVAMDAPWFPIGRRSDATTPARVTMEIAYIRVWAAKPPPARPATANET